MPELVVIADQLLAPVPGGTGRYTAELLRALVATAPPRWRVAGAVARHRDVSAAVVDGVRGPRVLPLPRRALTALWEVGVPYRPGGDAVHAPTPLAPPRLPGRRRGAPVVVTVHDTVPWTHPHTLTPRGARWHRTVIARALRSADAVVVPTHAVAEDLARRVPVRVPVEVVPLGVAPVFTSSAPGPARPDSVGAGRVGRESALPPVAGRYVLAVGTLEPRKGIDVLIEAMARLRRESADPPSLVLVGQPGWGGLDAAALARASGLPEDALHVLGKLGDRQLVAALRGASAVAVPSLAEGFGLPLLEAMASGVPVVHSDVPALREVAGGAGLEVPRGDAAALADALGAVLADTGLAGRMAAAGSARAAGFTWAATAEAVWRLHLRLAR